MPKSKKGRLVGCFFGFVLLCVLAVPVTYIALQILGDEVDETFNEVVATTEAESTHSAAETREAGSDKAVESFWATQTAVFTDRQTTTPSP